jgi:hypothetical protein
VIFFRHQDDGRRAGLQHLPDLAPECVVDPRVGQLAEQRAHRTTEDRSEERHEE